MYVMYYREKERTARIIIIIVTIVCILRVFIIVKNDSRVPRTEKFGSPGKLTTFFF